MTQVDAMQVSVMQTQGFALTPLQAGMLYEIMAHGDPGLNFEQVVVHLDDEPMDAERMAAAWGQAIVRFWSLRTLVRHGIDGRVLQFVDVPFEAPLVIEDWSAEPDPEKALAGFLAADRAVGVDHAVANSWRLRWFRLGPRRSVLVWSFSHVFLDGRSFRTLLEEVFTDYDGLAGELPEPPAFRRYAETLDRKDKTDAQIYFAQYLAGVDRPTPVGFPGTAAAEAGSVARTKTIPPSSRGNGQGGLDVAALDAALTAAQTKALFARADQAGVSFANLVQVAWGMVVARVAGQGEAIFGITRSGRYLVEGAQQMFGCLITTQPVRVPLLPDLALDYLLKALRTDLLAQRPHEWLGLPDISAVADFGRGVSLFDSLVMVERESLHDYLQASKRVKKEAWAKRRVELFEKGAMPLTLAAYGGERLQIRLEYLELIVSKADAARYLDYVTRLLVAMAESAPGVPLRDLKMMPPEEEAALLALAAPEQPLPEDRPPCIATAFAAVAARQPDVLAVTQVGEAARLDYAGLDRRANQLAHVLAERGIGPGAMIGLCLSRSPAFVALILAAAKLGAVFVPMDPSYPPESLRHMAQDSGAAVILVDALADWMTDFPVTLWSDTLGADAPVTAPEGLELAPDRAAYVIYTSGTTGKPKGVVVSQRAFVSHAMAAISGFGLMPGDRALQFAALSFDVALEEIVPTLLAGATLVLRNAAMVAAPQAFTEAVEAEGITVLNLPTGFWQVLLAGLEAGVARLPKAVRLMVVGGERMPPDALARWLALPGLPRLINGYGPTEATITSASFEPRKAVTGAEVPVGRAFGHSLLYLCAPDGSLAPLGASGEVWIGGDAVALGYLHQPEMTAARFVPNRFGPNRFGTGRMYRSGDVGHWNSAGAMVVAGRADRQIKIRGFRIEPGEIEALLESLPGVAQAYVGVAPVGGGRLVGWLRPSSLDAMPEIEELRAKVAAQLPGPKCPELVFVRDWPQTAGGKTDVKRLPMPQQPQAAVGEAVAVESSDPQVRRIAEIFATVLGGEAPGADVSFFDLGGHSLQLLTLIGHIEAAFSTRLTVAQVHAQPTPLGLSALLSGPVKLAPGADLFDCLMPIQPLGSGIPIYGVHVLGVNGSFFRPLAKAMGMNQPIFGLTVGLLSEDTPLTVEDTAALYLRAIEAHRPTGPIGLVAVSLGSFMALELAQQLTKAGRDVRLLGLMDAGGPAGRENIRGVAWLRAHLGLLRTAGIGYLSGGFGRKVGELRHRMEKLRISLMGRVSPEGAKLKSVAGFVAANAVAIENYQPRPYHGMMTIIRARNNVFDSAATIAAGLGWADVAQGGFEVIDAEGDHLSILEEPGVHEVAAALSKALSEAQAGDQSGASSRPQVYEVVTLSEAAE